MIPWKADHVPSKHVTIRGKADKIHNVLAVFLTIQQSPKIRDELRLEVASVQAETEGNIPLSVVENQLTSVQ